MTPPPGRTLWLLRHAKAVADPPEGGDDFDRVLAPRGRRDATALGQPSRPSATDRTAPASTPVRPPEPLPQLALVSPAARTMATADLVLAGVTPAPRRDSARRSLRGRPRGRADATCASSMTTCTSVMVVGHNPTAQALALGLLGRKDKDRETIVRRGFPTCALGIYRLEIARWADVDGQCAVLVELLTPPFDEG